MLQTASPPAAFVPRFGIGVAIDDLLRPVVWNRLRGNRGRAVAAQGEVDEWRRCF